SATPTPRRSRSPARCSLTHARCAGGTRASPVARTARRRPSCRRVMPGGASPEEQIARAMDGFLVTQLLYAAVKLGGLDALAGGPRSAEEVAAAVGARPGPLARVLRGLAAEEILDEPGGGRFALAPAGELLRARPGPVLARGELYYRAAAGLADALRDGGTP